MKIVKIFYFFNEDAKEPDECFTVDDVVEFDAETKCIVNAYVNAQNHVVVENFPIDAMCKFTIEDMERRYE